MAQKLFDNCGRSHDSIGFHQYELTPYKVDQATTGVIYMVFFDATKAAIYRITEADGIVTNEVAWGAWADRATLTYSPVNNWINAD